MLKKIAFPGLAAIFCFCIFNSAKKEDKYANGSGITITSVSQIQQQNLTTFCKVWGFLKYYHPAVALGKYNWDYELLDELPEILNCKSRADCNWSLAKWIYRFGKLPAAAQPKIDTGNGVKMRPDTSWISDRELYGDSLCAALRMVKKARRAKKNVYVDCPNGSNPRFKHENPYTQFTCPDAGYRLLSIFRYWNIIEYYYPYKYAIGENWDSVLTAFIPQFIASSDLLHYKLTTLSLVCQIHDTHASLSGFDTTLMRYYGKYSAANIWFVEGKPVVNNIPSVAKKSALKNGDIILEINKKPVDDRIAELLPYAFGSNRTAQLCNIAENLLRTNDSVMEVTVQRGNERKEIQVNCEPILSVQEYVKKYGPLPHDTCFRYLTPDISYIYAGSVKSKYFKQVMPGFMKTKAMIIDIRCYPSDFIPFTLGKYIWPEETHFAKSSHVVAESPGLFVFNSMLPKSWNPNPDAYKGKVIILVNQNSVSQSEYTAMAFRSIPGSLVIGSTTAGADGNVSYIFLPGLIRTRMSGIGIYWPDGRETQRVGIVPDIYIEPTIAGIAAGRDEVLEKAIEVANGN